MPTEHPTNPVPPMIAGGAMGQHVRDTDWSATSLGDYAAWPQSLRSALSMVLNTKGIAALYWGPEQRLLYNDAYAGALGDRHPAAFGQPMRDMLPELAPVLGAQVAGVLRTGEGFAIENMALTMARNGRLEDTVWTYSFSAVQGEADAFAGVLLLATEMTQQKASERARARIEVRLETALKVAKLGAFAWNPSTGMVDIDKRGRDIFALPAQGPVHVAALFERIAPDDVARVRAQAMAAVGLDVPFDPVHLGRTIELEYDIVLPDGARRSIDSSGAVSEDADGTRRMMGAFADVTDLKRAQARLHERNVTLEQDVAERTQERNLVWEASLDMLMVSDMEGVLLSVNPAWTRVLGWSADDLVGRTSEWLEHPDDVQKTRAEIARLAMGEKTFAFENRFITRNGDFKTLSWTAVLEKGKFYCVARDVTDEHRQKAALIEQTVELRRYRDIVEASEAPICAFDTHLRLIAFNRAHSDEFYRIYGVRVQLGDVFPDLFTPDQAPIMRAFMERALTGEVYTVVEEFGDPALIKPYWEVTYYPLRDRDGRIVGAFHYAKDITTRLRAQSELNKTQEALRQSQKMEAIGQLTGGVAHDFNNLLTVVKSATELLKRPSVTDAQRSRYITSISTAVDRAAKLTAQLLAFARRQTLKPEVFSANDSVRNLVDMVRTLSGSRIQITSSLPDVSCFVNADASQFDTALVNLAVNARDAMEGAGRIHIVVAAVDAVPAIRAQAAIHGPFVAVSLSDTGSGIPADIVEHIFEPFFTTKETGKGTGLGLSQVIGFATQSGGDVSVDSTLGAGTTFTLYMPRVAPPDEPLPVAEPGNPIDGHGTRVLVVEDNIEVGTFAMQSLNDLGYVTVLVMDARAALAELAGGNERFDLVFSDVVMPGMSGIELAQDIRRLYPDLPVVLTSGYSHVLAQSGTHGFELLYKPYSIEQLSRILNKTAMRRQGRRLP